MYKTIKKLIGNIEPYGDTNIDEERLNNIDNHIVITNNLIKDLIVVARYKDRPEYSINKIGNKAYNTLCELKEIIEIEM